MLAIFLSWHQTPEKLFLPNTGLLFGKYLKLEERIHITGVHDPIWIVCPRSWNAYQPCNLLPVLTFALTIRCPNLLRLWEKLKDFFFMYNFKKINSNISSNKLDLTYWLWEFWVHLVTFRTWMRKNKLKGKKNYLTLKNNNDG